MATSLPMLTPAIIITTDHLCGNPLMQLVRFVELLLFIIASSSNAPHELISTSWGKTKSIFHHF